MKQLEKITPWKEDFARWYTDVIKGGELMEYGPIKGTIYFKPNSYAIWENIQKHLSEVFARKGVKNVYLPMLIPQSFIEKEKEHVKGFAPELATVTHVGENKLQENLYIRPTSEVLFGDYFKKVINSYKDLPLLLNQWTSVIRWEKTTNPFLRTSEFLWQEGHTSHNSSIDARKFSREMIKAYAKFSKDYLAIPTIIGKKTPREKFAGACTTYTIEGMMKDGKALQMGTSHYLAQKFSKVYNVTFKNKDNVSEYVYQTSWGVSTRLLGALIMTHGDDRGIILPPKIAPVQVDILELFADKNPQVSKVVDELEKNISKIYKVRVDRSDKSLGFKAANSEIQGVPLRIEVGPKDLENDEVLLVRRDNLTKIRVPLAEVRTWVGDLLKKIQQDMYEKAKKRLLDNIVKPETYEQFKKSIQEQKFAIIPFNGSAEEEEKIQQETGATARCILLDCSLNNEKENKKSKCLISNKKSKRWVVFAKSY
ncbi:proline--tRNA ligase [Mycoplasma iguanae]|uniref:Proline--tRNA ligase n=1 Tax=Mycoplasma iguanae TaxID=292461 RepID=A0ABY5RAW5_9MOLU|nr:proline--tRNA ligase [Mycoplasma iguanae]UVD81492.1 proline--tRNA ligase [Mycoplasma iguanae]